MEDIIYSSTGKPYSNRKRAENAIPEGYTVVDDGDGGFIGVKIVPVMCKPILEPDEPKESKPIFSGLDVQCPGCGQVFFETTDQYNPDTDTNPAMINMKEPWKSYGWEAFLYDATAGYGCMVCPECGAALAPSGKLKVIK